MRDDGGRALGIFILLFVFGTAAFLAWDYWKHPDHFLTGKYVEYHR